MLRQFLQFEGARVFTNKPPCGPKRGHGTPQPRFALECQLDKAAEQLGLDPADLRKRILHEPFTKTANHLTVTTIGLGECIDKVVEASGWRDKRARYAAAVASPKPLWQPRRRKGILGAGDHPRPETRVGEFQMDRSSPIGTIGEQ